MLLVVKEFVQILFYSLLGVKAMLSIKAITSSITHAEGPHWDPKTQSLYYVDTFNPTVFKWNRLNGTTTKQSFDGNSIGIIVPIKDHENHFLVARDRKLSILIWNGDNNTGTIKDFDMVDEDKLNNQFNDGKVDCCGRAWFGTLTRNQNLSVQPKGGSVYKIEDGEKPKIMINSTSISNGMAWSKNNTKFFFCDSEDRKIYSFAFDSKRGIISDKKVLFDFENYKDLKGIPDGMTIDTNDNLWIAVFGGGRVLQVDTSTGKLLRKITMPVTYVTSCTFGGADYTTLYVTTSKLKLNKEERGKEVEAGCVFAIDYLEDAKGFPANEFQTVAKCICVKK